MPRKCYALLIPALNEAESIGRVLEGLPAKIFSQVMAIDNGSRDATAEVARAAGAEVVSEPRRGYGRASMAGLARLRPEINAIAFMDADLSDDPRDLASLVEFFDQDDYDLVVGSRVLGESEPGALAPLQRFGNWLTTRLIRRIWHVSFTDLGPMRVVSRKALERLKMRDPDFGWNVEMQVKAAQMQLRVAEVPVAYRRRRHGKSKISGTVWGSLRAGAKILWTVFRCWRAPRSQAEGSRPAPS